MNNKITITSPAKVNYRIDVIRKRDDGYHELRMIMQRISLCDEIDIELLPASVTDINVRCGSNYVPDGEKNIAWKAAKALVDRSEKNYLVSIDIRKKIPVGAGLGGGSSNAASVLMAMNELLELQLSDKDLMDIGVKLGADVPFFIFKRTAIAEGIGELLSEAPAMPPAILLLINPGIHVPTPWVYKNLQLTKDRELIKLPDSYSTVKDICAVFNNDLETVTVPAHPVISEIKRAMVANGAVGSLMSGSGSTVFSIFNSKDEALKAEKQIIAGKEWFSAVVETI